MTAPQLDDAILRIRANEAQVQQSQASYQQSQQQMVQMVQRNNATSQQAQQQQGGMRYGNPGYGSLQSPYRPPKFNPPPDPQPQFYVNGFGRVGYMLPF
jgi:hypothetical protein